MTRRRAIKSKYLSLLSISEAFAYLLSKFLCRVNSTQVFAYFVSKFLGCVKVVGGIYSNKCSFLPGFCLIAQKRVLYIVLLIIVLSHSFELGRNAFYRKHKYSTCSCTGSWPRMYSGIWYSSTILPPTTTAPTGTLSFQVVVLVRCTKCAYVARAIEDRAGAFS